MKVSLYDFDGTIYNGDSAVDFTIFSLVRRPVKLMYFPKFILSILMYKLKIVEKEEVKSSWFRMMVFDECFVRTFWNKKQYKLIPSVLELIAADRIENRKSIVISASPRFLLEPIVEDMNASVLLATETDVTKRWLIIGKNCYGVEKVQRFQQWKRSVASKFEVLKVVSDSSSDLPLYDLGGTSMRVRSGVLENGKP